MMWVILNYFPHAPVQVYGPFATEAEAREYAERQGMATGGNAYDVIEVRNVEEQGMYRFFMHLEDDTEVEWRVLGKSAAEHMHRITNANTPSNVVSYGWEWCRTAGRCE